MEDITKTGIKGLKGIRGEDLYGSKNPIDANIGADDLKKLQQLQANASYRSSQIKAGKLGYSALDNEALYSPQSVNLGDYGSSSYDEVMVNPSMDEINDLRASKQPWYAKVGAGIVKAGVLAGTTFLDSTAGLLYGTAEAIKRREFAGLWDNDFSKAMQSINEASEELLPNYYSTNEINNPLSWDAVFSANFLGDKLIKNLGFTIGALYSGGLVSKGINLAGRAIAGGLKGLGATTTTLKNTLNVTKATAAQLGSLYSAVNEGRIEALNNSTDWAKLEIAKLNNSVADNLEKQGIAYSVNEDGTLNIYDDKQAELYNKALGTIQENRLNMGNMDLLHNIPILWGSNLMQFGKLFSNGFKSARKTLGVRGTFGNYESTSSRLGAAYHVTNGAVSEGLEELSQGAASRISGNYYSNVVDDDVHTLYNAKNNPKAQDSLNNYINSFSAGLAETLGDENSWQEFLVGTITGALGAPRFRSAKGKDGKWRSPITLAGGAYNELKEYNYKWNKEKEFAAKANEAATHREYYTDLRNKGLAAHLSIQDTMDQAVLDNDEYTYKNAEHNQLVNDIITFDSIGKLNDLKEFIKESFEGSPEELEEIIKQTTTKNEDGTLSGPFSQYATLDSDGNISAQFIDDEDRQSMAVKIFNNQKEILNTIDAYRNAKDDILMETGEKLSSDQLSELTWMNLHIQNQEKRAKELGEEVHDGITSQLEELREQRKANELLDTSNEENDELGHRIEVLENLASIKKSKFGEILGNSENAKLHEQLLDAVHPAYREKVQDLARLGKNKEYFNNKLEEYLESPQKQIEEREEVKRENDNKQNNDYLKDSSVGDVIQGLDEGYLDFDDVELDPENVDKVNRANAIRVKRNQLASRINSTEADDAIRKTAIDMLNIIVNSSQSPEDLSNLDSFDFQNNLDSIELTEEQKDILSNSELYENERINTINTFKEQNLNDALNILKDAVDTWESDSEESSEITPELPSEEGMDDFEMILGELEEGDSVMDSRSIVGDERASVERDSVDHLPPVNDSIPNPSGSNFISEGPLGKSKHELLTPDISNSEKIDEEENAQQKALSEEARSESNERNRQYWKSNTTEEALHLPKGIHRPYHEVETSTKRDLHQKIHEYLIRKGAFANFRNMRLKKGTKVFIGYDPELNKATDTMVPLLYVSDPVTSEFVVIGDMISLAESDSPIFQRFPNYYSLIQKLLKVQENNEYATLPVISDLSTSIADVKIGTPMYSDKDNRHTLNEIAGEQDFELAIYVNPTRIVVDSGKTGKVGTPSRRNTTKEDSVLPPLSGKSGQPYILVKTSGGVNQYVTVPIVIPKYDAASDTQQSSTLFRVVQEKIQKLVDTFNMSDKELMQVKEDIQEYLNIPHLYISRSKDGNIVLQLKTSENGQLITLSFSEQGITNAPAQFNQVISNNVSYIVDVKKINSDKTLNGVPYNRAIGELANTNLEMGGLHTVNDFVILNPLDSDGMEIKAVPPKSTRQNSINNSSNEYKAKLNNGKTVVFDKNTSIFTYEDGTLVGIDVPVEELAKIYCEAYSIIIPTVIEQFSKYRNGYPYNPKTGKFGAPIDIGTVSKANNVISKLLDLVNKVIRPTIEDNVYKIGSKIYERVHTLMGNNWKGTRTESAEHNSLVSRTLGTEVDRIVREFFGGKKPKFNSSILTDNAYNSLMNYLQDLKRYFDSTGEKVYANNLVLAHDYGNFRMAGELDIITIDKYGNFRIYDLKTSKYSFADSSYENPISTPNGRQINSTKKEHTRQLSLYADMLEREYSITAKGLFIIPVNVTYDNDVATDLKGNVMIPLTRMSLEKALPNIDPETEDSSIPPREDLLQDIRKKRLTDYNKYSGAVMLLTDKQLKQLNSITKGSPKLGRVWRAFISNINLENSGKSNYKDEVQSAFDKAIGVKPSIVEEKTNESVFDKEKELERLAKMLPQLSKEGRIRLVDKLIEMSDGNVAWGSYLNGVVSLYRNAARGTTYHEAFHYVIDALLDDGQYKDLFELAKEEFGDLSEFDLEEKLADGFKDYVIYREDADIGERIKEFFNGLWEDIKFFFTHKDSLSRIYRNIYKRRYSNRQESLDSSDSGPKYSKARTIGNTVFTNVEDLYNHLSDYNSDLGRRFAEANRKGVNSRDRIKARDYLNSALENMGIHSDRKNEHMYYYNRRDDKLYIRSQRTLNRYLINSGIYAPYSKSEENIREDETEQGLRRMSKEKYTSMLREKLPWSRLSAEEQMKLYDEKISEKEYNEGYQEEFDVCLL